ncbi:NAD(+)/NADH kinase [Halopenitus persicus]|uniref:NAD kinase n=1 Tax=Halopenitus persicus TaxID=1048396 RepID=A0A1H3N2N4_9EURY|nr:NAD(+)/NADH kinase [Halopenitus persicus]QHS17756.1 NAD(+)/NADH kinase [haloarchaeon 3A1-DGR]SDY83013.1 NAD+ kinase [Halopenitus persicus]
MDVGIVAQKENPRAAALVDSLADSLADRGVAVRIDELTADALETAGDPVSAFDECDLVVAIGGDGTFLFAARNADGTPVLGVNLGEVGFLNAVAPEDAEDAVLEEVTAFREGEMDVREAPRLVASVGEWRSTPAANEITVQGERRGRGGGIDYEVRVGGALYSGTHADGVLVATQTGSTAYNLSENGPILHPGVEAIVLNEMCADEGMAPLAVDTDAEITVTVTAAGTESAVVISDGRRPTAFDPPLDVTVSRADVPMRIAGPRSDFFEALGKLE